MDQIPDTFEECLSDYQRIQWLKRELDKLKPKPRKSKAAVVPSKE